MPFLSVEGVSKRFDGVTAVDGVSFAVDRGEVVGFLGPNGAGKSTTMRLITQYYEPDTGEIRLDGVPLAAAARAAKRRLGHLPQNNPDPKSTRLNSSHPVISYAVFCLKKKKNDRRSLTNNKY